MADFGSILRAARDRAVAEKRVDTKTGKVRSGGITVVQQKGQVVGTKTSSPDSFQPTEQLETQTITQTIQPNQNLQPTPPPNLEPTKTPVDLPRTRTGGVDVVGLQLREGFETSQRGGISNRELKRIAEEFQEKEQKKNVSFLSKAEREDLGIKDSLFSNVTSKVRTIETKEAEQFIGRGGKPQVVKFFGVTKRESFDSKLGDKLIKTIGSEAPGRESGVSFNRIFSRDKSKENVFERETSRIGTIIEKQTVGRPIRTVVIAATAKTPLKAKGLLPSTINLGTIGARTLAVGDLVFDTVKSSQVLGLSRSDEQLLVSKEFQKGLLSGRQAEQQKISSSGRLRQFGYEVSTFLGDKKSFETGFNSRFVGEDKDRALKLALRSRRFTGSAELSSIIFQSASIERGGRFLLKSLNPTAKKAFGVSSLKIGGLGFGEGFSSSVIGDKARGRGVSFKGAITSGLTGTATAGPLGGLIFTSGGTKAGKFLQRAVYVTDIDEFAGDKLADLFGATSKLSKKVFVSTPITATSLSTNTKSSSVNLLSNFGGKPTFSSVSLTPTSSSILSSSSVNVDNNVVSNVDTNVFSNVNTNVGTNVGTNVASNVNTNVGTNVGTNVASNVNTNVFALTDPVISGLPLAFGGNVSPRRFKRRGRRKRSRRAVTPTLFSAGFNIRGSRTKFGVISGLGIRPLQKKKKKKKGFRGLTTV